MRKIVNFRAPLFVAIGFILGILSYYEFLFGNIWLGLITLIALTAVGVVLFILKFKVRFGIIAILIAVLIGFFWSHFNYYLLTKDEVIDRDVIITGRVCDILRNGTDSSAYYLEDCVDENGVKYDGRIQTYIFYGKYQAGDILTVRGKINSTYPLKANPETYKLRADIRYEMDIELVISRADGHLKLDETARKYIFDTSTEYAPRNADVLYALLTGDRNAMDRDKLNDFKLAGIVHLLAVSGLHVGFVVAVIGFVLKRFKMYPLIECAVMLVFLLFYAYICDFTPSVVRAIIMVACTYLARAFFGRYDLLTSLSFAVIILLLLSPFTLFDCGFQLSALSVFGIAVVYPPFNRFITKRKLPKIARYPIDLVAVSLACSLATFFTLQLYYGYASVVGILLNIIAIPLVTVCFVVGWVGLLPFFFHYALFAVDWILEAVVFVAKWVAGLSFATASIPVIAVSVLVTVVWLFVLGGYVNLRKIGKIIANSVLAGLLILSVGLSFVKLNTQNQIRVVYGYNDTMCVASCVEGDVALVGNFSDSYSYRNARSYLNRYGIKDCVLYLTDYGQCDVDIVEDALRSLPIATVYKLDYSFNSDIDEVFERYNVAVIQQKENASTGNSLIVTSVFDGELRAVIMRIGKFSVSSVYGDDSAVANYLNLNLYSDVYVLKNANKAYADNGLTTLSMYQSHLSLNYGANKYGTFTITQKGDKIKIDFR